MGAVASAAEKAAVTEQLYGACTTEIASFDEFSSLLAQALANLVDNAIKYTPAGGRVTITVAQQTDGIVL